MRYLFIFLLLAHGLIHLLGFVKAFQYLEINQLTQPISRSAGLFWLLAGCFFLVAALLFLLQKDSWWMFAASACVVSQVLVFMNWQDARVGTIANLIVLVAIVLAYGSWRFHALVNKETQALISVAPITSPSIVTKAMLAHLPPVVQKWLERSNVIGKAIVHSVHLRQTGRMKLKPDSPWVPLTAEQYFTVQKPGFIWTADIQAAPMLRVGGRDKYQNGQGHMLVKLLYLYPVADAKGPAIDQGSMLRFLAETAWFPSAALSDYIRWEAIDSTAATATMCYGGITASGVFRFNDEGDLLSFETKRYYTRKEGATLEDWWIENTAWQKMDGLRIPYQSEVTWKLKTGAYTWLQLEIEAIEYNGPALLPDEGQGD